MLITDGREVKPFVKAFEGLPERMLPATLFVLQPHARLASRVCLGVSCGHGLASDTTSCSILDSRVVCMSLSHSFRHA